MTRISVRSSRLNSCMEWWMCFGGAVVSDIGPLPDWFTAIADRLERAMAGGGPIELHDGDAKPFLDLASCLPGWNSKRPPLKWEFVKEE